MRHLQPVLFLVLAGNASAQQSSWVWFHSAETASPPQLVLELQGGEKKVLTPSEDTLLIGYIADRAFAAHQDPASIKVAVVPVGA